MNEFYDSSGFDFLRLSQNFDFEGPLILQGEALQSQARMTLLLISGMFNILLRVISSTPRKVRAKDWAIAKKGGKFSPNEIAIKKNNCRY